MSKLKKLDPKLVNRNAFANHFSYQAALYAVDVCNHIIHRVNQGDIVFEYEQLVVPHFEIRLDSSGSFSGLVLKDSENSCVAIVDSGYQDDPIYCTKREIKEYFKLWRVVKIVNVSKVTDLTK